MEVPIELGYRLAGYLRQDLYELDLVIDERSNACGIITIAKTAARNDLKNIEFVSNYVTVCTCEDAQAWGTVTGFNTLEDAQAHLENVWEALNIEAE